MDPFIFIKIGMDNTGTIILVVVGSTWVILMLGAWAVYR